MIPDKIVVRFEVRTPLSDLGALVPILHGWIRRQALPGATLIDVADYGHVPGGPGIVLVAFEANYAFSVGGFEYQRKRPFEGPAKIEAGIAAATAAADLIESETPMRLDRSRVRIESNDRLRAPNDEATFAAWAKALAPRAITRIVNDPRERLAVVLSGSS